MFKVQERRAGVKAIWAKNFKEAVAEAYYLMQQGKQVKCTNRDGKKIDLFKWVG